MYEEIEAFIEQNTDGNLEGTRGVENLKTVLIQIGYDGLGDFLADCPGAIEAMLTWIGDQDQMTEWRDALLDSIAPDDDHDDDGDPIAAAASKLD
jgi:hypothetical protein